jgi:hypothetical protein
MSKIGNILSQASDPSRLVVMIDKLKKRILDTKGSISQESNIRWLQENSVEFAEFAHAVNAELWIESQNAANEINRSAEKALEAIPHRLGGGAAYPFLYFVTRHTRPSCILETGVAAGYSSYAFLLALDRNGQGKLYSSDFPYFRLPNPDRYIGIVPD